MRKWFLILILAALFIAPTMASAQTTLTLSSIDVQLWPEYDQPNMLVIVDYIVPSDTKLPVDVTFHIPKDTKLVAVANYATDGTNLINAVHTNPKPDGDSQVFTITLDSMMGHFEYYQPIVFNGEQRSFAYVWNGDYAVNEFIVHVLEPLDTTALTTTPKLDVTSQKDGLNYYSNTPLKLDLGKQFNLDLKYNKTSDALVSSQQPVKPSEPLDSNTNGRVSLNNYLLYIIGGVGLLLIIGGVFYYMQANSQRVSPRKNRQRSMRRKAEEDNESGSESVYCAQCGARAREGDRFCRTCGSRIRQQEE